MKIHRAFVLALLVLPACRGCGDPAVSNGSGDGVSAPGAVVQPASSLTRSDLQTTSPEIALGNLDGQINQLEEHVKARPKDVGLRTTLAGLLRQRSQINGSSKDLEEAFQIGEQAPKDFPDSDEAKEIHVHGLSAVHRFHEALAELEAITAQSKDPLFAENHGAQRGLILEALGRYDEALPLLKHQVEQNPSPANLDLEGILLGVMGKVDEAEASFVLAEQKTRDTSPIGLAALYFDRASLWEREGDLTKATDIYRAAYAHLPQHVHVASHLAALVTPKEAVAILEPLGHADSDPEVLGALGTFREMVKTGSGKAALDDAKSRYDELMKSMPEAYADHAGWFWLSAGGDPEKAFDAAKKNLAARETAESFDLYLAAAAAAHHHDDACAIASKARSFPYPSHRLTEDLRQLGDCPPGPAATATPSASAGASAGPATSASAAPSAGPATSAKAPAKPAGSTKPAP